MDSSLAHINDTKRDEGADHGYLDGLPSAAARHNSHERFKERFGLLANKHLSPLNSHLGHLQYSNHDQAEWCQAQALATDVKARRVHSLAAEKNPFTNKGKHHRVSPQVASDYRTLQASEAASSENHVVSLDKE